MLAYCPTRITNGQKGVARSLPGLAVHSRVAWEPQTLSPSLTQEALPEGVAQPRPWTSLTRRERAFAAYGDWMSNADPSEHLAGPGVSSGHSSLLGSSFSPVPPTLGQPRLSQGGRWSWVLGAGQVQRILILMTLGKRPNLSGLPHL